MIKYLFNNCLSIFGRVVCIVKFWYKRDVNHGALNDNMLVVLIKVKTDNYLCFFKYVSNHYHSA